MNYLNNKLKQPLVVYFHRYSIEYESVQFPITRRLIDLLVSRYKVLYFSMGNAEPVNEELRKGIKVKEINLKINHKNGKDKLLKTFLYYLRFPITLIELKKQKPSFIICKETLPFIPLLIRFLKIPMLIDASDWWWSILLGNKKLGRKIADFMEKIEVERWNNGYVTVVAHSKTEADLVAKKGFPKEKIKIVNAPLYKGVYFSCKAEKEKKILGIKKHDFTIAIHGIIHPSKGYDQLLNWWKEITKYHKNWKLIIIGGSIGENWCRNKIKELDLSKNTIMTGWLPSQKNVNKYLNTADCFLVTRRNTQENQGVIPSSLFHSLMIGKPVVATGLPGISEIINNKKDGFLFEPDNFKSFKSVLEFIYKNPKKALKIGKQGIKRAKECFDPEKAARGYFKIINSSLQKNNI